MAELTTTPEQSLDPGLLEKVEQLKAIELFGSDPDSRLVEKQFIFYALVGIKPASEVGSFHMEWLSPDYGESHPDDKSAVATALEDLGLYYRFGSPYDGIVTVARDRETIEESRHISQLTDEAELRRSYGRLYGYPETAVEAVVAEWVEGIPSLLGIDEQERIQGQSGLPREAFFFRFSRAHWQDELATVRQWYGVLTTYGMDR